MKPLVVPLDKLQGENRSFLGYVAPTILVPTKEIRIWKSETL